MPIAAFDTMVILWFVFTALESLHHQHPPLAPSMTNSNVYTPLHRSYITPLIPYMICVPYAAGGAFMHPRNHRSCITTDLLATNDTSYTTAQTI